MRESAGQAYAGEAGNVQFPEATCFVLKAVFRSWFTTTCTNFHAWGEAAVGQESTLAGKLSWGRDS